MRLVLAFAAVLASSTAATAQVVQDRYGPPRAAAAPGMLTATLTAPYVGRTLSWASKTPASAETALKAPAPTPAAVVRSTPPDNLDATPPAEPAHVDQAPRPFVLRRLSPDAPPEAEAAPAAPQVAAARAGVAPPRLYSLHRQYGMTPDLIPPQPAQPRYVLIGPPDEPDPKSEQGEKTARDDDGPSS